MLTDADIKKAIQKGWQQADTIISLRNKALKKRAAAIAKVKKLSVQVDSSAPAAAGNIDKGGILGPPGHSTLIAEGDSWFDYPGHDILKILEDLYGYEVESVAHMGDRVEEMAYTAGQFDNLMRLIEKVLRNGKVPKAILLSGGGNDIAGEEFGMLLNHISSPIAGLNHSIVSGVIEERAKLAYLTIIGRITAVCESRIGKKLPILIHGYDYPVPDGRGFMGGWWFLPGPWLEPGFREKGFSKLKDTIILTKELIDCFNAMLQSVAAIPEFGHVHYVNLRGTLSSSTVKDIYEKDWANELHPSEVGFKKVTSKFADKLANLP